MFYFHEYLIEIQYQPKFSSISGCISSVEVLSRCFDCNGLSVPVEQYINSLKCKGLINQFTIHLLSKTIDELSLNGCSNVDFSINLFQEQLNDMEFIAEFIMFVSEHKGKVTVELSEKDSNKNKKKALSILNSAGVDVSLDDFGIENSTFEELLSFEYQEVKIDKSMLTNEERPIAEKLVSALARYCHRHGLRSVAEGIDSQEKLKFVLNAGIDELQGFFLSKPLAIEQLELNQPFDINICEMEY
ncbi:EAL domain-containing protein [Vibrio lentus]|uniref:EAL domain-containing protein n=1 Tax=Vibrio lentus TaxID=136468 RepID=UPI00178C8F50|nr:EAL domain-containing protein [Vibrio lentus]MDN3628304.1 EAL domain-containing protein [Vibrio lentus]